jgi:tetratricopeptide (TPR) repeat protein
VDNPQTSFAWWIKSICARSNTYSSGLIEVGQLRFCEPFATLAQDWPYPQWLKASLAGLCLLLVFALLHGKTFFEAGKNLYRGEQLVEKGQYSQSLKYLKETLRIAPESDKGVLLTAKAALMSGDVNTAQKALNDHHAGKFEDANDPVFQEVQTLWNRAVAAEDKLDKAAKLYGQPGHDAKAAALVHEAANLYPQLPNLQFAVDTIDEAMAFDNKDYDQFLRPAKKEWDMQHSYANTAALASALACKYATTGEMVFWQQSEEMLQKAKELIGNNKEEGAVFNEYSERIRYRLDSRKIIDKAEYDQKFRKGGTAVK